MWYVFVLEFVFQPIVLILKGKPDDIFKRVYDGAPVLGCWKDRPGKRSRCLSLRMPSGLPLFMKWFLVMFLVLCARDVLAVEAPRYDIDAVIDVASKSITARQQVTFKNRTSKATDAIYFHIYPNRRYTPSERAFFLRYAGYFKVDPYPDGFPQDAFQIKDVRQDNSELTFAIEGDDKTILKVALREPLGPGESVTVSMDFAVKIPHAYGRFGWNDRVIALSRWYPILSVYDQNGWSNYPFYPFHRPFYSQAADYHVRLTVPSEQTVIHTGDVVKDEVSGMTRTLEIATSLPVREFTMAMSPDYKYVEGQFKSTTIRSYYLPGHQKRAQVALDDVAGLADYYSKKFGDYPYKSFSIAPVYLGYGGEQMSNLIFIDTRVYDLPQFLSRYFDFLIAHETGHQWFYNVLGIDSFKEIWMEEGFNSYFLLEYLEHKYGANAEIVDTSRLGRWLEAFIPRLSFRATGAVRYKMIARQGLDHPIIDKLSGYAEPSTIFSLAYGKGSIVLEMLKEVIGEDAFNRVYARLFKEYAHQNVSLDDFKRICQEESAKDLNNFFNGWLHTAQKFDVAVAGVHNQMIELQNRGGIAMPVDVEVSFSDGSKKDILWDAASKKQSIDAGGAGRITRVVLDPQEKWLDLDRTNNQWPIKIHVKPVPLYLPLYDIPIFLPEDSYNVVVGPEINQGIGVKASIQKPYDQILYGATDYDFNNKWHTSRVGYELENVFSSLMTAGIEMQNRTDLKDGEDDLVSGKVFLRQELWPAPYGLFDVNDHVSLYLIRNQSLNRTRIFGGTEDIRNASYLRNDQAIVGSALHLGRARPYPDPREGYTIDAMIENSGHFLGATQQFTRTLVDYRVFNPVTIQSKLALRLKYGWGSSDDKNLFELGGIDGLRGFDRKTVRGANAVLGSLEYRFPLLNNLNLNVFDNILGLQKVSGVAFFDAGQSWYSSFKNTNLRKDAGVGLRFHMNIGSFLEQMVVRVDAAQAINDSEDDVHYWFGVNHQF